MDNYFIIKNFSDGISIEHVTKDELLKMITPDEYGYHYYGDKKLKFLDYIPGLDDGNLYMDDNEIIVIKGNFVIPKEKQVVIQYEL